MRFNRITMTRITLICFLLLSVQGFSQNYINKTKAQVKKELDTYVLKNAGLTPSVAETDSSIELSVKGLSSLPTNFTYRFDKTGKCNTEKVTTFCDSCYTKSLEAVLANKQYQWKKINANQYVSNFASRMLIELALDNKDFSFIILRTDWSKEMYDLLKGE